MPLIVSAEFDGQNWLITPAVSPNAQTNVQTWLIVLSGVAVLHTTANETGNCSRSLWH
jgi:hypothetical protein